MKTIGFADFYISEWHANNYPAWIEEVNRELGFDYALKYAWAEQYVSPVDGVNTDEWCEKYGVTRVDTLKELCERCDAIILLAPSNPEKHIVYAKEVLTFGKPTYIDKPFSDNTADAKEMFSIAEKHGTPFFSSSALRYAAELDEVGECKAVSTLGGGSNLEEYIIHQVEMAVKKLGIGAESVRAENIGEKQTIITVNYKNGKKAAMHFAQGAPFSVIMEAAEGNVAVKNVTSAFFPALLKDVLTFFEGGKTSFNTEETLEVNRIMTAAIKAKNNPETTIII